MKQTPFLCELCVTLLKGTVLRRHHLCNVVFGYFRITIHNPKYSSAWVEVHHANAEFKFGQQDETPWKQAPYRASEGISLPSQTALIKEMQNVRLGFIQLEFLSVERVPILEDGHFFTHYRSHYRVPTQCSRRAN